MKRLLYARGFTLIELVVTAAIVAVMAVAALPMAELTVKRSKELELRSALRDLRSAIDAYKRAVDEGRIAKQADESGYPKSLQLLIGGVRDEKNHLKTNIYFMRRIPRDPFASSTLAAADTWGRRSYASPPDAPREGNDVFDVYSLSDATGINGIPYHQW